MVQPLSDTRLTVTAIQAELNRRRWLMDPAAWVRERLDEHPWSKQVEIMESVRDNRLTAVRSAHATGKSYIAARIVCWWMTTHPPGEAYVVTTASTWRQVETVLWKEIRRAHAKGRLPGRTNRTEWVMPITGAVPNADGRIPEEVVAFGHRPADDDPTAMHGIHAPYVLIVIDEADGIPEVIFEAAGSLISNEESRMLAIGNPLNNRSHFAKISKPGSGWAAMRISAFDTPNFTNEDVPDHVRKQLVSRVWVEEAKLAWGESNPLYIGKVLGEFPELSDDNLIPVSWVTAAQNRWDAVGPDGQSPLVAKSHPVEFGVDVGAGGDKNVIYVRWGSRAYRLLDDREPDTMKTVGNIKRLAEEYAPDRIKVDYIGIGQGAVDRLREQKMPVDGVKVGSSPTKDGFRNLRAEGFWHLRELFRPDKPADEPLIAIDPKDDGLLAQLIDIRYEATSDGKIQIESKEAMRRRNKRGTEEGGSPDRADALMLCFLPPPKRKKGATWGKRRSEMR